MELPARPGRRGLGRDVRRHRERLPRRAPWWHPTTVYRQTMLMRHGWDGEVGRHFLLHADGEVALGRAAVHSSDYDNLDAAWVELSIHPEQRRRGYGTAGMRQAFDVVRSMGRTKAGWFGWVGERTEGFAAALGCEPKSVAVCRRQHPRELDPGPGRPAVRRGGAARRRLRAPAHRRPRLPTSSCPELAEATEAINDAPLDGIELDDEVFTADRVRAYERAQLDSGYRFYRVIARHRGTGEIAGLSVVTADSETPSQGHQHDTSVVRGHRGHRLGLLLKADMMRWLSRRRAAAVDGRHLQRRVQGPHGRRQRAAGLPGDGSRAAVPSSALGWETWLLKTSPACGASTPTAG